VFQCVKINAESDCHLLPDNMPIFDRMQKWLYDSFQKVSKPFHPLFAVSIRGCFQGLFCKPYSSGIPIDNNQEELDLVTEVANPLHLHFCSFFLSTVAEKSHLKYDVVLHQNEQELHHAETIFLRNYLEKYFVWLELFDLQVVSHTFEHSDFLKKKNGPIK
jgi:hypothetical protein